MINTQSGMLLKNFLFHRVSYEKDRLWPPMTPSLFESIIRSITRKHRVIALEEFLSYPDKFRSSSQKLVTISFDDGFKDNIEYAAPILQKYRCPASFYIVTDCIDKNIPTWTYLVDRYIQLTGKETIDLAFNYVPASLRTVDTKDFSKSRGMVPHLKPWLKTLPNHQRVEVVQHLITQCDDVELPNDKMMSWNDIRQLGVHGFYIGSHSHTHPLLASITSEQEISEELRISADRIKTETGIQPQVISYPIGSFDQRVIKIAETCGYKWALAVEQRFFHYGIDNLMAIPRMELYEEPWWKMQLRKMGIISTIRNLWS